MKQDFNNPVDSLLRDYARRRAVRAPFVPERLTIDHNNMEHLDADEIAAFAENALPAAARARTVAHLADCDGCRQLVSALTHWENTALEAAKSVPPQSLQSRPSWREKFAAFFALPAALRYGVPALAILLFVALVAGIMVNRRQQPDATLVASRQETQTTAVAPTNPTSSGTENSMNSNTTASSANLMSDDSASMSNTAATATTTTTTTTTTANTTTSARHVANANLSNATREASTTSAAQNNSNSSGNTPVVADLKLQPAASEKQNSENEIIRTPKRDRAAAVRPSAPIANANISGNSAGAMQSEQVVVASDQVAKASKGGNASSNSNASQDSYSSSFSIEARAASRRRAPSTTTVAKNSLPVNGRAVNNADLSASPSTSRRVNGRDFRRHGTSWVDVAYVSSQSTTNIARGSKQYRAVVNAEPGIGKIAAQLDGEVVVIWKGRAYRIR